MKQQTKVQVDILTQAYNEMKGTLMTDDEVMQYDRTELFWATLKDKINHNEIIDIAVRGEVRLGKSTIEAEIVWKINRYLIEQQKLLQESPERRNPKTYKIQYKCPDTLWKPPTIQNPEKHKTFSFLKHLIPDQTEFLRYVFRDKLTEPEENVMVGIDEYNKLANTGTNAFHESAYYEQYSNMFASRFVHRVSATPTDVIDKNATIILDIKGRNFEDRTTTCMIQYRSITDNYTQRLGRVTFYVGDLIGNTYLMIERYLKTIIKEYIKNKWKRTIEKIYMKYDDDNNEYHRTKRTTEINTTDLIDYAIQNNVKDIQIYYDTIVATHILLIELTEFTHSNKRTKYRGDIHIMIPYNKKYKVGTEIHE